MDERRQFPDSNHSATGRRAVPDDGSLHQTGLEGDADLGLDPVPAQKSSGGADHAVPRIPGQMLIQLPSEVEYRCPGESHAISRAVHLSRLAAFYPACRECQHRHDTGLLAPRVVERIQQVEHRVRQRSVFQANGVRGVFLNDMTATLARQIARTFASLLWEAVPLTGRMDDGTVGPPARRGPSIVVGYDERPSSPLILSAVVDSLRMMGCPVIDIGLVSRPCFDFAVDHLQAAGGVFVTGSGCGAAWSGLDLVGESARPMSQGGSLDQVESGLDRAKTRPTRRAAHQRSFQAVVPYEAGLLKHFHALRPLSLVVAIRPRPVRQTFRKLFSHLPCSVSEVETTATENAPVRQEVLIQRVSERIASRKAHLGLIIDDDGARCWFFDETGRMFDSVRISACLTRHIRSDHPHAAIVVGADALDAFAALQPDATPSDGGETQESLSTAMAESRALFGGGALDRYWFRESYPACDAILTVARMLQVLSRGDASASVVVGHPQ